MTKSGPVQRIGEVTDPEMRAVIDGNLTVLPNGPRIINAGWDDSCNLSCPSCRTTRIIQSNFTEILNIQNKVEAEFADAHTLYITGSGDPFGSPGFNRWLRTFDASKWPKLKRIHLHTNAQLWSPRMWDRIADGARVLIRSAEISIDAATPETYALNRRGGCFHRLLQNLEFIPNFVGATCLTTSRSVWSCRKTTSTRWPNV